MPMIIPVPVLLFASLMVIAAGGFITSIMVARKRRKVSSATVAQQHSWRQRQPTFAALHELHDIIKHSMRVFSDIVTYTKMYLPLFERVNADCDAAKKAMESNDRVRVFRKRHWLFIWRTRFIGFEPLESTRRRDVGVVLYPGAFVAAEAYTPLARSLAELGCCTAVAVPPLGLSFTNVNLADEVIQFWGDKVRSWMIVGHSMGGVVAAAYAKAHAIKNKISKVKGITFLASYPSGATGFLQGDLSDNTAIAALCCYGTLDGLCSLSKMEAHKQSLPTTTVYCRIEGGNHSQFYYGTKLHKGDNPATITRDDQQAIIRQAIVDLLDQLS